MNWFDTPNAELRVYISVMSNEITKYRNNVNVVSNEGIVVEAHSLWELKNELLVLVDDDQYATHKLNEFFHLIG